MKTAYLKVLPLTVALLLAAACNNQDLVIVDEPQLEQTRIIPFTATAGSGIPTRATLNNGDCYVFEDGDKLYVWGTNIYGELGLTSGEGSNGAEFSGNLIWSGEGNPNDDLVLNAVIVSPKNQIFGKLAEFNTRGHVPDYTLATLYAEDKAQAVQYFSYFEASSIFSEGTFTFKNQLSALVFFEITLDDGTMDGHQMNATINNGGVPVRTGTVTAHEDVYDGNKIKAKFVAGFPGDESVSLSGANIQLGDREPISFGGTTKLDKSTFYRVTRYYTKAESYKISASALGKQAPDANNKPRGFQTTLQDILVALDKTEYSTFVLGCSRESGTSVDCEKIENSDPLNYRFTVIESGESVFTMTATNPLGYGPSTVSIPVTINVSKMPPTE